MPPNSQAEQSLGRVPPRRRTLNSARRPRSLKKPVLADDQQVYDKIEDLAGLFLSLP
jgi:hypothetical protein